MKSRKAEFKVVKFGEIRIWPMNPRAIIPEKLQDLAKSIDKYGLFKTLTCWKEGEHYITGGGNMRYKAMKEILKYDDDREITIAVNDVKNEAEKIEISLLDNQPFGFYDELEVGKLIMPHAKDLDLDMISVNIEPPLDLEEILIDLDLNEEYAPLIETAEDGSKVPISGDLVVVGIGNYCSVMTRAMVDEIVTLLQDRFGNNRREREVAGMFICKLIQDQLIPQFGEPPMTPDIESDDFKEVREGQKEARKEAEKQEYIKWKNKKDKEAADKKFNKALPEVEAERARRKKLREDEEKK